MPIPNLPTPDSCFAWRRPPYEYEETLPPIDILWGSSALREGIETGATADQVLDGVDGELGAFSASAAKYLLC